MITAQAAACFLTGFFGRHTFYRQAEVTGTVRSSVILEIDASAGRRVCKVGRRNLDIDRNLVVKAEKCVDIGCRDFSRGNGSDDRSRSRNSVAAGKEVKLHGGSNDLLERILADPIFGLTRAELNKLVNPHAFTGMAVHQTETFLREQVAPVLNKYTALLGCDASVNV